MTKDLSFRLYLFVWFFFQQIWSDLFYSEHCFSYFPCKIPNILKYDLMLYIIVFFTKTIQQSVTADSQTSLSHCPFD